jgi:hypothetical protein
MTSLTNVFARVAALPLALLLASTLAVLAPCEVASASWQGGATAGSAKSKALSVPTGAVPTVSVSGRAVTASWSAASIGGSGAVPAYTVKRYSATGVGQTVGSGCAGSITATTCTESGVDPGSWRYTVTPRVEGWAGGESAQSAAADVGAPALTLSTSSVTSLPATVSGSVANFVGGANVSFRLDNPTTGTTLAGTTTPAPIGASGAATVSVTIPSGTANGAHTVYAIGDDGSVASATIEVAVATCSAPTLRWLNGVESGVASVQNWGGVWEVGSGAATADSAVKRTGAYSLRMAPNATTMYRAFDLSTFNTAPVARFAIRFASLPSADAELAGFSRSAATYLALRYVAATGKLAIGFPGQTVSSLTTVEAGTWYVIDMKYDPRADPHTGEWRINGVAQPSTSYAQATTGADWFYLGALSPQTYSVNFDDIAVSEVASDYPIGDGRVRALLPNGMGTNVGAGFTHSDGTAISSTTWNRLDDVPLATGTDGVKQTVASSSNYVEVNFEDTTATCVRGVMARVSWAIVGDNKPNNGKTAIVTAGTERTLYSGDMSVAFGALTQSRYAMIAPTTATWTADAVNALRARLGYSTDVSPQPNWQSLMLEYETAQ